MKKKTARTTSTYRPQAENPVDSTLKPDKYDKTGVISAWFECFPEVADPTAKIAPAYKPKPGERVQETAALLCHCLEAGLVSFVGLDADISDLFQLKDFTESCAACLENQGYELIDFRALLRFNEREYNALFETGVAWGLETFSVDFYRILCKEGEISIRKVARVIYPCSKPSKKDKVSLFRGMPYQSFDEFTAANAGTSRASEVGPLLRERLLPFVRTEP